MQSHARMSIGVMKELYVSASQYITSARSDDDDQKSICSPLNVYDWERILSMDSLRNCFREERSALGNRAWMASRAVLAGTVLISIVDVAKIHSTLTSS